MFFVPIILSDTALLDYEINIGVAASEGLDIEKKEINYKWTYVQSVFFTSTIITTVGEFTRFLLSISNAS